MSKEEPKPEVQATTETTAPKQLPDLLQEVNGAPSKDQIEKWKAVHGDVYVSGFSETEMFVWRTLTRAEYVELQRALVEAQGKIDQYTVEENICSKCVLWPALFNWNTCKGGIPSSISEQVMTQSHFLSPQVSAMLVAKL